MYLSKIARVLIANRGEIARRVIAACREVGLQAVAVHSEADAGLPFVAEADEAVCIGPAAPRESYLRSEALLDALRATGADAVHPGYGFLAENADFAEAVIAAGATWIGPAPDTIRQMGDKQRAREIAVRAGLPVVPGSRRFAVGDTEGLAAAGDTVGYPLLVKASAGGGGIGMRRVDAPDRLAATVDATQSMAAKAFGDGTVFLERFIPRARHVEVQVFGFGDGRAIHAYERDCSLQRRFQKVIEESPAPGLSDTVRAQMAEAAVALAEATHYAGAGTVEFILDVETQDFFFLEMNTRIQVEHPVTEMVTGLDLVGLQLALAAGTLTALTQAEIRSAGAAVECRLYAENPAKMFLPAPGPLTRFILPEAGPALRIDAGYAEGNDVTPHYDPLIAKFIAHGQTRAEAIATARAALTATEIEGLRTNRDFLIACLDHEAFAAGDVHTGFVDAHVKALTG
jgi:acetyl/propionyl-CoA carboxylase alpha subunit